MSLMLDRRRRGALPRVTAFLHRRPVVAVFLGTAAAAFLATAIFQSPESPRGDGTRYLTMAADPGAHVGAPHVTRVLAPLIVWVLPLDNEAGLRLLTGLSFAVTAALLYWLLADQTGSWRRAAGGVAIFIAGATTANIRDPFFIDAFSYAVLMVAIVLAVQRRWWWLVVVMPLAVLTRDALVILAAPAFVVLARRRRESWLPLAVAACSTVAVWVLLTKTSLVLGFDPPQLNNFSRENIEYVLDYERQAGSLPQVAFSSVMFVFGAVWLAPFFAASSIRRNDWAVAVAASSLIAVLIAPFVTDWDRALGYAFPVIATAVALLPRGDRLVWTFSLALSIAVSNYGVQNLDGGAVKYLLELLTGSFQVAVLYALWRRRGASDRRLIRFPRPQPRLDSPPGS
jgi:hypothetical protein